MRPNDYGIPLDAEHWDERTVRNVKLSWADTKNSKNFLWEKGFQFYCLTPKSPLRPLVVGERGLASHLELQLWRSLSRGQTPAERGRAPTPHEPAGGARTWVLPTATMFTWMPILPTVLISARLSDPFYRVSRLVLRLTYNAAYPYNVVMMKHGSFIATEKTVMAQQTRPDGLSLTEKVTFRTSASARSNPSRATGTCRCTRPTRYSTNPKRI
ncbi:MAG: hypothetical protein U1F83_18360 [Verrucomicrobiota bacterium]